MRRFIWGLRPNNAINSLIGKYRFSENELYGPGTDRKNCNKCNVSNCIATGMVGHVSVSIVRYDFSFHHSAVFDTSSIWSWFHKCVSVWKNERKRKGTPVVLVWDRFFLQRNLYRRQFWLHVRMKMEQISKLLGVTMKLFDETWMFSMNLLLIDRCLQREICQKSLTFD